MIRTIKSKRARGCAVTGVAAAAAVAAMSFAGQASAGKYIDLHSVTMDTHYQASVTGVGRAYSNGLTFTVSDVGQPYSDTYSLFGFCIDIFHDIAINKTLNYQYYSSEGDPGDPLANAPFDPANPSVHLTAAQEASITSLVDMGAVVHRNSKIDADASVETAAIQAAIWEIENPGTVSLYLGNLTSSQKTKYQTYYNTYLGVTGPAGQIYTLTPTTDPKHQSFAVGVVPEPATWALMLTGFFGAGAVVRRRRSMANA